MEPYAKTQGVDMKDFDIGIIGSGPGGYRAAVLAALRGQKVAIIERATWGGTCLNRGCVPKKDWHESAKWIEQSQHFEQRGIIGSPLRGDLGRAWKHQHEVVNAVRQSYLDYLKRLGVRMLEGSAQFIGRHELQIDTAEGQTQIHCDKIIIATGSRPALPQGIETVPRRILHSDELFDSGVPEGKRVIIVGGGIIGTEFAYIFTMLGKQVTWLVHSEPLSHTRYSEQAKDALTDAFAALKIEAQSGFILKKVGVRGDLAWVEGADGQRHEADWVLLATGRHPQTQGLGLERTAVRRDERGFIVTDAGLETDEPGVYAIGDVVGPLMNANQALADATLVVDRILGKSEARREPLWVPELVYSALELARIGMDEEQAEDADLEPAVGFAAFETSPRALGQDDAAGFVRLLADMDSGAFLGGEIVGRDAGELIHLLAQGSDRDTVLRQWISARYNHPARAEEVLNATETLAARWGLGDFLYGES